MQTRTAEAPSRRTPTRTFRYVSALLKFTKTKPLGAAGLYLTVFAVVLAVVGPFLSPHDPWDNVRTSRLVPPNSIYWFGTDALGRDVFSRLLYGARISMLAGLITTVVATAVGGAIGVASAYYGGRVDMIVQRFVDAKSAFPPLLLALALMTAFGPSLTNVILAMTIIFTSRGIRVIRSQVLSIKETPYIDAARALGARDTRIMLLHVFPNTFGPMMVVATSGLGAAILLEASLSFLGVGMPTTVISWGGMLSGDVLRNFAVAPWIGFAPGLALTLVVFAINVLGDALRDVLDPRMRGK